MDVTLLAHGIQAHQHGGQLGPEAVLALCSNGAAVTAVDLDESKFGLLTAANASTYYAGGSSAQSFSGTINYILVLSEVLTDTELKTLTGLNLDHDEVAVQPLGTAIGQMFETQGAANGSNTWMFDGGSTTVGSVTEIGGIRNYAYQFEEYVRGIKMNALADGWSSRQRFVVIVGRSGQTLADSLAAFDDRAAALDPRAAVYLIGAEDYAAGAAGIEAFRADLLSYITKAVALRNGTGFAVIQTPYPNAATGNDELYAQAAREVTDALFGAARSRSGGFNARGFLMLRDLAGDTHKIGDDSTKNAFISMATSRSYDFYLFPEADGSYTIRRAADDSVVEGYSVDAMLNVRSADGSVDTHLFMADSPYQVYPTNYLYLTTSTDGLNWSAPQLLNAKNHVESAFLIGPGSGTYDPVHGNMVFTAYSYSGSASSQKTCLLWAGDDGVWNRSESATTDVWSSEASAVVLEDGTVRVFYRSGSSVLCYTDYLWVDGAYVRDQASTSVSTGAAKNAGNGCMLTAVMYPEKVGGRELILVATPATSNSRSNGHIYAFYVNQDGSMELASSYDITPNISEYYAYSCLTVLTQGKNAGDLGLFWENAAAGIRYDIIRMVDVLPAVKEVVRKDVTLKVGETASFEDPEGYYAGANTDALDTGVATVEITGTVTESVLAATKAVNTIESGRQYVLVNNRAGKPMTNAPTTSAAAAGAGSGLSLSGSTQNVTESAIWTLESVNGGYRIKDADGKYLTVTANGASVTDAESIVSIARNGSNWTISQNGAYLNDFGGNGTCAAGWQHSSAPTDAGSQWSIYTLEDIPVAGTSVITFTAVGEGQTQVQIGYVLYCITVTEDHSHAFGEWTVTKEATCTEEGVRERVCECGEKEIEVIPALGHDFVNGECSRCDETLTSKFEDVPAGAFYFDPVEWAVVKGITTGATETTFNPNGECQRAQVVTFLWRAAGSPEPTKNENPFTDVKETDFYYKAVLWAVEKGITNGLTADTFGPFALCNRAQVVTFLWRAMGSPESTADVAFTDVIPGQFYSTAVAWAVENNITNGISATEFGVGGTCNRAQVVTFLYRTYVK